MRKNKYIAEQCAEEFEEYTDCGSACPLTCDNPTGEDVMCIDVCVPGCFCKKGYVRDENGKCVEPKNCASTEPCKYQ